MWLNVGGLGWHHIAWSGIGNCNIIILFNLHDMGGCFFSKSFERGESNIIVLFFFLGKISLMYLRSLTIPCMQHVDRVETKMMKINLNDSDDEND